MYNVSYAGYDVPVIGRWQLSQQPCLLEFEIVRGSVGTYIGTNHVTFVR